MPDLLARIDYIMRELSELRAEVAEQMQELPMGNGLDIDSDFTPEHLIDTHSAQERFGHPRNTIARRCREEGVGLRQGGRWLVSVPRLRRWLNGGQARDG